ncbi:3-deoxy-D-manno-octulosonic acid transferase [Geomesophilobacter sediminis]|uniref:3-deoxy-D-manno-octulosonic acid transferase n=1 Tax=Geomesophilobacter sediminis TaxID=2798584 RepID=A0A8J7JMG6_9BACT|nr:3-deoxy-D-manno-octulosonic acid transferase [Geomesophilobacter sediminis]MBJ6725955.1 3-deoxy-D-manno-octulosonic acid transferase [Geomesophilobacter sediminis]
MVELLYNLLLFLLLPFILAYHCYRSVTRGRRSALAERFGFIPADELAVVAGKPVIFVHAVSVGETMAAVPLLKGIRGRFPEHRIVLSNVTETGRSVALKSKLADLCIYFPFDFNFAVAGVLDRVRPDLIVIMETEIWPNFIRAARARNIPVVLANGRISDRSLKRYLKLSWFFGPVLREITALCMQTAADGERIGAIGARPDTVRVTGNLKYDLPVQIPSAEAVAVLKEKYRIPAGAFVFTAASTHEGEEGAAVEAYRALVAAGGEHFMILAPRHPERAAAVAELLRKEGVPFRLRSTLDEVTAALPAGSVLLLDTVGELARLYGASDLVFVGGSLVPTGGHNPLEPAACGVAALFGPHMENFREIATGFLGYGAGLQVPDPAGLAADVVALYRDTTRREQMGRQGARLLEESAGATRRHLDVMQEFQRGAVPRG